MANYLSLTQRQTCEKIAESMNWSNLKVSGLQAFLTALISDDYDTLTVQDLIDFGVLEKNRGFSATTWTSDAILNGNFLQSQAIKFFARTIQYTNTYEFTTISNAIGGVTWAEYFGTPIMDKVHYEGYHDMVSMLRANFDFGTTYQSSELCIQIGNEIIKLCDITIDGDLVNIAKVQNVDFTYAYQQLGIVVAGTKMIVDLCQALSDGLHTPADLFAVLQHYTKSSCSAIATFAQGILKKGRESIRNAIFEIVSLFRSTFGDYSEDSDGNITWNITSTPVSSNFWLVARNILIGGGQMLGQMLLFAGNIVFKIVGGVILVGASIVQAISTFTGTITGTAPMISDDAIDACYHDPIAQQDNQDISSFLIHPDLIEQLELYNRAKIVVPSGVLYLYNYKPSDQTISWKLFANVVSTSPILGLTYSYTGAKIPGSPENASSGTGGGQLFHWHTGFFSWGTHTEGNYETDWCFSVDDNNGKTLYYSSDAGTVLPDDNPHPMTFKQFINNSLKLQTEKDGVSLSANSADAGNWKVLWHILKENVIQCLCYVFCNTAFYEGSILPSTINSVNNSDYSVIGDIIKYDLYSGAPGYASMVNAIINLGAIDHSNDKFLYAFLMSLGLLENGTNPVTLGNSYLSNDSSVTQIYAIKVSYLSDIRSQQIQYSYEYVGLFPFMSIDPYAYVTPPTSDFKSIIFGAIFAAIMIAAVIVGMKVLQSTISKKLAFQMQTWGKKLLEDGETFRNGFSPDELKQLTPTDRATYYKAYKSYKLKVTLYNMAAGILGLSSLDWINNWWNPYQSEATELGVPVTTDLNADSIEATTDLVDSVGSLYKYTTDPEYFEDNPTDAILLYRLISGSNPSQN